MTKEILESNCKMEKIKKGERKIRILFIQATRLIEIFIGIRLVCTGIVSVFLPEFKGIFHV